MSSLVIAQLCAGDTQPDSPQLEEAIRPALIKHFKPALLARMRIVPYYPIAGSVLEELVELKLQRFAERLERRQLTFSYDQQLVSHLAERCLRADSGARLIDQLIDEHLQPQVVDRLLDAMAKGERVHSAQATLGSAGAIVCEFA